MKKKSNKLKKLESKRFSLFSDDVDHCYICGDDYKLTWHEIFEGRNRQNSMKYGLCLRLCLQCHSKYQNDALFNHKWHQKGQIAFEANYNEDFLSIFYRNYKD